MLDFCIGERADASQAQSDGTVDPGLVASKFDLIRYAMGARLLKYLHGAAQVEQVYIMR